MDNVFQIGLIFIGFIIGYVVMALTQFILSKFNKNKK